MPVSSNGIQDNPEVASARRALEDAIAQEAAATQAAAQASAMTSIMTEHLSADQASVEIAKAQVHAYHEHLADEIRDAQAFEAQARDAQADATEARKVAAREYENSVQVASTRKPQRATASLGTRRGLTQAQSRIARSLSEATDGLFMPHDASVEVIDFLGDDLNSVLGARY